MALPADFQQEDQFWNNPGFLGALGFAGHIADVGEVYELFQKGKEHGQHLYKKIGEHVERQRRKAEYITEKTKEFIQGKPVAEKTEERTIVEPSGNNNRTESFYPENFRLSMAYRRKIKKTTRYRRRYRGSSRGFGRRNVGGYRYTVRRAGFQPELKFFDTNVNGSPLTMATGNVNISNSINLIEQGSGGQQRNGKKVIIKSIQLNIRIDWDDIFVNAGIPLDTTAYVRLFLVLDMQCNGSSATASTLLQGTNDDDALIDLDWRRRFKILKEWRIPGCYTGGYQDGVLNRSNGCTLCFKYYKKCNIPIRFNAQTPTISNVADNNLILMCATNRDNFSTITCYSRLRFVD